MYRAHVRALKLFVVLLRSRFGLTLRELLEEVDCNRRTLYRYLEALEEAGVRLLVAVRPGTGELVRRIDHVDGRRISGVAWRDLHTPLQGADRPGV